MNFTRKEKLAIFLALDAVVTADRIVKESEKIFLANIIADFELCLLDLHEARDLGISEAGKIMMNMSKDKKEYLKEAMTATALADGDLDVREIQIITLINALLI